MANRCQVSIHSIAKEAFKANYLIVLNLLWGFDICLRFIIFTHYHFQYNWNNGILSNDLEFMCQSGLGFGVCFFFFFFFIYLNSFSCMLQWTSQEQNCVWWKEIQSHKSSYNICHSFCFKKKCLKCFYALIFLTYFVYQMKLCDWR